MPLESSDKIAECCEQQHNCCRDQTRGINDNAEPLDQAHGTIDTCSHVVGSEASDEIIKGRRSWTYAEEQGYLNEDKRETRAASNAVLARFSCRACRSHLQAYYTKYDEQVQMNEMRYAKSNAKYYTKHSHPVKKLSAAALAKVQTLFSASFDEISEVRTVLSVFSTVHHGSEAWKL